jgi:hypothetical protein
MEPERRKRPRKPPPMMGILGVAVIVMCVAAGLFVVAVIVALSVGMNSYGSNK